MAQRVYTTEGIVLGKYGSGEASVSALILTDAYGLVRMRAQSARNAGGKLRYALEPMTLGNFSFVRGLQSNRLIGAEPHRLLLAETTGPARQAAGQLSRLLLRLIPGEAADEQLFALIRDGLAQLAKTAPQEIPALECAIVLALLMRLGYLPENPELRAVAEAPLALESVARAGAMRLEAVRAINRMLASSGL